MCGNFEIEVVAEVQLVFWEGKLLQGQGLGTQKVELEVEIEVEDLAETCNSNQMNKSYAKNL